MALAYVSGDLVGTGETGGTLRFIGRSRSRGRYIAVDVSNGELYVVESATKLGEHIPLPKLPYDAPGSPAWIEWAKACFRTAPSLGLADRISDHREEEADSE